ncbi:Adaptor complexes medium subunit family protein [Tritrichomonas foetus]|uniref:Adaptor complexes medium subunit family protein n=1 Tax=Tritrichomonas foetus TaxID=1144522 RepID=A0A1J4JJG4_9EUKA|nr:Adaptor complexes medium subunit family protein [Tritrichomonas foetus]|eukprot:OHS99288.1 Adaptor complexes medium subunit family protein [Tritrichomonas foetus]
MIKCIYIINLHGEVLIEKYNHEKILRRELEPVCSEIKNCINPPQIIESLGNVFILTRNTDIYIVGVCDTSNTSIASVIIKNISGILHNILKDGFNESSVKADYPLIYQILDMYLNNGVPFIEESSTILSTLDNNSQVKLISNANCPWRAEEDYKGQGEFYLDVVETLEVRINSKGKADLLVLHGMLNIVTKLSGYPFVSVSISSPHMLEDYSLHRCVDPSQFQSKKFRFIPPNGGFTLMTYLAKPQITNLPIFISPKFTWSKINVIFEVVVRLDDVLPKPKKINVYFELPEGVSPPSMACEGGTITYDLTQRIVKWDIDPESKDSMILNGSAAIAPEFNYHACDIIITTNFMAKGYSASGINIEKAEIDGFPKVLKSIQYITKSGVYSFYGNI